MSVTIHHRAAMPPSVALEWALGFPNHEAGYRNDSSEFASNTAPRHSAETGGTDAGDLAANFALLLRSRLARSR